MHVSADDEDGGEWWGLMVGPEIILHVILELLVVVLPHADVDDQEVGAVYLFKILGHIVDGITVSLLEA